MGENANSQGIEIGRLLSSAITGFSVGTSITNASLPRYGALVRTPVENQFDIYGLIFDIRVDEDGLIRQLATTNVDDTTQQDNINNRNTPLEISVLTIGYKQNGQILHLLPPRPPLSLNRIYLCTDEEICEFTGQTSRFGYLRHILRNSDLPISELLATHIRETNFAHEKKPKNKYAKPNWAKGATKEIIATLRNEYEKLTEILSALSDALPDFLEEN